MLALVMVSAASAWADGLTPKQDEKKGKWGYVDASGEWVIKPKYDSAGPFMKGQFLSFEKMDNGKYDYVYVEKPYAIVSEKGKFGYLKENGKWHVKAKFLEARPQFIGAKGDKRAYCMLAKDEKGWGVIFASGEWASDDRYEEVKDSVCTANKPGYQYPVTYIPARKNGRWGFIACFADDVPFIYDEVGEIQNGIAKAVRDGKPSIINVVDGGKELAVTPLGKDGQTLAQYVTIQAQNSYQNTYKYLLDKDMNVIPIPFYELNTNGKLVIGSVSGIRVFYDSNLKQIGTYKDVTFYESGNISVRKVTEDDPNGEDHAGLLDAEGHEILPCKFNEVSDFNDKGLAMAAERLNKPGEADKFQIVPYTREGKTLAPSPTYTRYSWNGNMDASDTPWRWRITNEEGEEGVFGKDGKMLIPMGKYDMLSQKYDRTNDQVSYEVKLGSTTTTYSEEGSQASIDYKIDSYGHVATKNGKHAFVDSSKKIISQWFDAILAFSDPDDTAYSIRGYFRNGPVFIVKSGGKYGIYDIYKRKLIVPCVYEGICNVLYADRAVVQQNGLCGAVDTKTGRVVITPKYIGLTPFSYHGRSEEAKATYKRVSETMYYTVTVTTEGEERENTRDLESARYCQLGGYDKGMADKLDKTRRGYFGYME